MTATPFEAAPKDMGEKELERLAWRIYCQFAWHGDEVDSEELRHGFLQNLRHKDQYARSAMGAAKMVTAAMEQRIKRERAKELRETYEEFELADDLPTRWSILRALEHKAWTSEERAEGREPF